MKSGCEGVGVRYVCEGKVWECEMSVGAGAHRTGREHVMCTV